MKPEREPSSSVVLAGLGGKRPCGIKPESDILLVFS
jgi:hypothetical protein